MENLANGSFRLGLATVSQLALHPDFTEELGALIRREGGVERAIKALQDEFFGTILIPADATAEGLIANAKAEFKKAGIPFTFFNEDLLQLVRQDLELVRGKTLQIFQYNFGRAWETSEGREVQTAQGFDGNAAGYLAWVTKVKPMGWSTSIANDDARLWRYSDDDLCAPGFGQVDGRRRFDLYPVQGEWRGNYSIVGFRAI